MIGLKVMGLVGCAIEHGDEITGARIVDKSKPSDSRLTV
jgi:hypothetical protein